MMDLGKQRQQQYQIQQLEMQQKQQELEDQRRLREALATGGPISEKSTLKELTDRGIALEPALKILTNFRAYNTAASQEKTADITRQQKEGELETKRQQEVADTLYGVRSLPPEKRQAAMDLLAMSELDPRIKGEFASLSGLVAPDKPLGIQKPGMPTPLIEPAFRATYAAGYNPQQLQSLLSAEAEAAQKSLTRPLELRTSAANAKVAEANVTQEELETTKRQDEQAGRNLGLVYDQPSLTKWYSELPAEQRARIGPPPTFNPANMQRFTRMFMTAEQRVQADKRTDKLLTPEEFAQQLELAKARAAAVQEGKPPTQGEELLAGYAARVAMANKGFEKLTMGTGEMAWNKVAPFDFMKTEAGLNFGQDERNFINAVLRRESGAAISPGEFAEARSQYIPQPNDPVSTLEKKRRNRLVVQQSLIRGAARAYVDPDQLLRDAGVDVPTLQPGAQPTTAQPAQPPSAAKPPASSIPNPITKYKETAVGPNGHTIGSNDGQKTWYDVSTGKRVY